MKVRTTRRFDKDYAALQEKLKKAVDEKLALFISNPRHPSLRAKKMEGTNSIWEMRVSASYRITFQIIDDEAVLRKVGTHDVLKQP